MPTAPTLTEWLVEGLHKSGAIACRKRAEMFLMPRAMEDEREAILATLFPATNHGDPTNA